MFTLRQLQAFFWAGKLQSFSEAAAHLNISQSALSKRVAELEAEMGRAVFDRSSYRPALTHFGRTLLERVGPLLADCDEVWRLGREDLDLAGKVPFGLTELVASTWLPHAVSQLRHLHPRVMLEPHVNRSAAILQGIRKGSIGLGLFPIFNFDDALEYRKLADVQLALMASPALLQDGGELLPSHLANYPVLTQAAGSVAAQLFDEWAARHGVQVQRVLATNSLTAMIQLVLAGVGIGFLPRGLCQPLLATGRLRELASLPAAEMPYYAVRRKGEIEPIVLAVEQVLLRCCDFTQSSYADSTGSR